MERQSNWPDAVALMCPWPNGKAIGDYPVKPKPPTVCIASAEDDQVAPTTFALAIAEAVKRQGGEVRTVIVPSGGHEAFHVGVEQGPGAQWPTAFKAVFGEAAGCAPSR